MKTTGKEWKAFVGDDEYWGGFVIDTIEASLNGKKDSLSATVLIGDDEIIVLEDGFVWNHELAKGKNLIAFFREWKKRQTTATLIVECDKTAYDAVVDAIKAAGGKVVK